MTTTEFLQTTLDQALRPIVGAAVAIDSPTGEWYGASGLADLAARTPLQADDRFQIGSITKPFTSTVVLQLVEEGELSLDDRIDRWLPAELTAGIANADTITIRQLLNHTSGIPDYVPTLLSAGVNLFREWQPEELVGLVAGQPGAFTPGTSWQYANTNYVLLGEIVETATGNSIAVEIRDRISTPLGLSDTFFADVESIPDQVSGYWDLNDDGRLDNISSLSLSWAGSAGALVSNTRDLVRFTEGLFGGELLQPQTLNEMLTFVEPVGSNTFSGYGLGIAQLKTPAGTFFGHTGLTLGFRSSLWYSPDEQLVYVDLQNTRRFNNLFPPLLSAWNGEPDAPQFGTDSNDFLIGSGLNDALHGEASDDLINSGLGNDFLWGGAGRDRFSVTAGEGIDAILDFEIGQDRILISGDLRFEQLAIAQTNLGAVVSVAATGDRLIGLVNVDAVSITADSFVFPDLFN